MEKLNNDQVTQQQPVHLKEQPVHLVDLANRMYVPFLKNRVDELSLELDEVKDKYSDLDLAYQQIAFINESQSEMLKKQAKQLRIMQSQMAELNYFRDLSIMAELVFVGDPKITAADYLKKLESTRKQIHIPNLNDAFSFKKQ